MEVRRMDATIMKEMDYREASAVLVKSLGLKNSPVAIRLAMGKEEIPEGMEKLDGTIRHCQMVNLARKEGRVFYATVENHECMGGAWALGLRQITETLKNGQFYFKLGKFESTAACKRTIDRIPHVESGSTYATLYAPLEKTNFSPHLILVIAEARAMLKLAQATLFRLGGRITSEFSGIQSVCADACAQTFLSGKANYSLGCDGSRKFSGIEDGEMVMGLPVEMLPEIVDAVRIVTAAPGSKK
ncbi:MAG TPA: DUF169 domain-containing protein [Methanolinea sp.]|nr:DUF169 domain-containing protein [Methanolinea sp.]HQI14821.1 DUF169 domain-containing protein [Methanolinea sp.]HQJ18989.1 DUF169 domain-containing protein [Methanolinea sp.]